MFSEITVIVGVEILQFIKLAKSITLIHIYKAFLSIIPKSMHCMLQKEFIYVS